ncbi:MAG: TolC family protein [bacterium]
MKNKTIKTLYIFILLFLVQFSSANAQNLLTMDDVVNIALKNSFDILVARNTSEIARTNNTAGNAGMLPTLQVSGSGVYALNNVNQERFDGTKNSYQNNPVTNLSAAAELSWTLFDGGKMFVTKSKLNEIEALGEIQFKSRVLETMYQVIGSYYDIIRQKQQLKSINEVINYNRERVLITETGFNAGSLAKTDLLQAKIDLNVALENAINQEYAISAAKKSLNSLLGQSPDIQFEVSDSIPLTYSPDNNVLTQKLNSSNIDILSFQKNINIAKLTLKENQSAYLPRFDLVGTYNFTQLDNSASLLLTNRTYGPQVAGILQIPLYNSGETRRKIAVSKLEVASTELDLKNIKLQMLTYLQNTLKDFENQRKLLEIETENKALAKENFEISLERLRLGQTNSLEVHLAQEQYVLSCTRLVNFQYNLKIAETKLKQLVAEY